MSGKHRIHRPRAQSPAHPFASNIEYLGSLLDYLRLRACKRYLARRVQQREGRGELNGQRRYLCSSVALPAFETRSRIRVARNEDDDEVSVETLRRRYEALSEDVRRARLGLNRDIALTCRLGRVELPLEELAREHHLDEFEKLVIVAALGPSLDSGFEETLRETMDVARIEVRTVLDLLCDALADKLSARRYFTHRSRLVGQGLIQLSYHRGLISEADFLGMDIEVSRRVTSRILGEYDVEEELVGFSAVIEPEVEFEQVILPARQKEEVLKVVGERGQYEEARRAWGFDRILAYGKGTVLLFSGPSGTGKTMLAHAVAKRTGHRLMLVDATKIADYGRSDIEESLRCIFHEARLQHAILFFDEADELFSDRDFNAAMPTLLREFERLDGIAILATNRRQVLDEALERRILYKLEFELPTPELREAIWRCHLPEEAPLSEDIDLGLLAEEYEFTGGLIKNAVLVAVHHALQRPAGARAITMADLRAGAQVQLLNRLMALTDKRVPRIGLDEVVLAPATRQQVDALVAAARKRSTVYATWGFGRKLSLGRGLAALFTGQSGVGKTMTAEAIAHELGSNLYVVQVASVVSKYVGETEKNLKRVFDAARKQQAILFFDEADAFFAERLQEGSHHAHYINQQINALLLEIERFDGLVVLATNRPEAFDTSFERRLRYRVHFAAPDAGERAAIWQGMVPAEAPLGGEVDFAALAGQYPFTGGTIKNVMLRAAFKAATDGGVITQRILDETAREEQPLLEVRQAGFAHVG